MDGLTLLSEARAAGLTVLADGDKLVVRGPRSAADIARLLLAYKGDVLLALAGETRMDEGSVDEVPVAVGQAGDVPPEWIAAEEEVAYRECPKCGSWELWETLTGEWRCRHCDAAALERSRKWLEKATRIRESAQPKGLQLP